MLAARRAGAATLAGRRSVLNANQQLRTFGSKQTNKTKAKKSKDSSESEAPSSLREANLWATRLIYSKPTVENTPFTPEELARSKEIAAAYHRGLNARSLRQKKEIRRRLEMRDAALATLSKEQYDEVLKRPAFPPPLHREMPYWTPPNKI